jgi:hypothetical protein
MSRTQAFQLYLRLKLANLLKIYRIQFAHYQVGLIKMWKKCVKSSNEDWQGRLIIVPTFYVYDILTIGLNMRRIATNICRMLKGDQKQN